MRLRLALATLLLIAGCATPRGAGRPAEPVSIKIIAFNDFHGNLEPPRNAVPAKGVDGAEVRVPAGGAAYLASAVAKLRAENPASVTVSAGDLIGASPFVSAQFLDEPTILAMNLIGLDLNAVGNHEFDRGPDELLRMQRGGCAKFTPRQPCRLDARFPGARFGFLAANVRTGEGSTLFPATAIRSFGKGSRQVKVGFIGLTLKNTGTLVVPSAVAGLSFEDEAESINALVPKLKAEGADAIVVLIHQGLYTKVAYDDKSCGGVSGDLLQVLARLDPAVDVVVSGHTHNAYLCDYGRIDASRPFLVTSGGTRGVLVTDIDLSIDPATSRVTAKAADQVIVQGEGYEGPTGPVAVSSLFPSFPKDQRVSALIERYAAAAAPIASRVVGRLSAPALKAETPSGESVLADLIADSMRAASGADIAFVNQTGVRADLVPDASGNVTFGQLFSVQPFANSLVVKGLTGRQIRALLEQQFASGTNSVDKPFMLPPSAGFTYGYDLSRPEGQRIVDMRLNGAPIEEGRLYRVATNNFLAAGGDNFTMFTQGTDISSGGLDLDALEAWITASPVVTPPAANRITRLDRP